MPCSLAINTERSCKICEFVTLDSNIRGYMWKTGLKTKFHSHPSFPCPAACGHRMAHRKWKENKQQPGTAGPGNMLGNCLVSFCFLWAILCPQAVLFQEERSSCAVKFSPPPKVDVGRGWSVGRSDAELGPPQLRRKFGGGNTHKTPPAVLPSLFLRPSSAAAAVNANTGRILTRDDLAIHMWRISGLPE